MGRPMPAGLETAYLQLPAAMSRASCEGSDGFTSTPKEVERAD